MSYQQKNIFVSLFSTVLVFGVYFLRMFALYRAGHFDGADATILLGKSILLLIVASIVVNIITRIVFNIVFAIATNDAHPSFVVDERDRLIELRGLQVVLYVLGVGFFLSMGVLALGQTPFLVFNMIILSFAVGDVVGNLLKLRLYRRGF